MHSNTRHRCELCVDCGDPTIYSYLPQDVQSLICDYVGNHNFSHLKCQQCEFIVNNNLPKLISHLCPENYDYHEEEDQKEFVDYLVDNEIIKIYHDYNWAQLKWNYKSLNISGIPNDSSFLVELTFLDWLTCKKFKLVDDSDKKILFEIPYYHDMNIQIILLLEKLSVINWVIAINPYENFWEEQQERVAMLDDFVIAGDSDNDDDDDNFADDNFVDDSERYSYDDYF